jgi:hypothetical protein
VPWKYTPHILTKRLRYSQCEYIRDHHTFTSALDTELPTPHPVVEILLRTIDPQEVTEPVQLDPLTLQAQETALTGSCTQHKKHVVLSNTVALVIQMRHVYQATSQNTRSRSRQFGIKLSTLLSFERCRS